MTRIAAAFDGSGIDLDDLGLKRPSLDDVFLRLTGHRAEEPTDDDGEEAHSMTLTRLERPEIRRTSLLSQSLAITRRNLIHIKRMPEMLMDVTIQPVMFVVLFAFVFGGSIAVPGVEGGYNEWLMAGIMGQTIAFASFIVAIGLTADIDKGIVDRMRSLPIHTSSVLVGRSLSSLIHSSIGIVVMSLTGLVIGWRIRDQLSSRRCSATACCCSGASR